MSFLSKLVTRQTTAAGQIKVGDTAITLYEQTIRVRWPRGQWIWKRPSSIVVAQPGRTAHLSVVDVTRVVQLSMLGVSAALAAAAVWQWLASLRSKEDTR